MGPTQRFGNQRPQLPQGIASPRGVGIRGRAPPELTGLEPWAGTASSRHPKSPTAKEQLGSRPRRDGGPVSTPHPGHRLSPDSRSPSGPLGAGREVPACPAIHSLLGCCPPAGHTGPFSVLVEVGSSGFRPPCGLQAVDPAGRGALLWHPLRGEAPLAPPKLLHEASLHVVGAPGFSCATSGNWRLGVRCAFPGRGAHTLRPEHPQNLGGPTQRDPD